MNCQHRDGRLTNLHTAFLTPAGSANDCIKTILYDFLFVQTVAHSFLFVYMKCPITLALVIEF
ncbi:hypothetical protein GGU45_001661 [Niabella hirudinis]